MLFEEIKNMSDEEKLDLIMILIRYVLDSDIDIRDADISEKSRKHAVGIIDSFKAKFLNQNKK